MASGFSRVLASLKKKKATKNLVPKLLQKAFAKNKTARAVFDKLSAYKQNEYSQYIATAKQEKKKRSRLEKILPMIELRKGPNDMYR